MDRETIDKRRNELLAKESHEPVGWWWLSFADDDGFRGACIVKAHGFLTAVMLTHALNINPGGECKGVGPVPIEANVQPGWENRLLNREQCQEFDRVHMEEFRRVHGMTASN